MPRNPRQRRRFQANIKQRQQIQILSGIVFVLLAILLISLSFNFKKKANKSGESAPQDEAQAEVVHEAEEISEADEEIKKDLENSSYDYEVDYDDEMYAVLNDDGADNETVESSGDATAVITALGNIMCDSYVLDDAKNNTSGDYDFAHIFRDIKYFTQTSDLCIANLETSFAGSDAGYQGYPKYNTPDALAKTLKNIGTDVVAGANNHSYDYGIDGIRKTIGTLDQYDISHMGIYESQEKKNSVLIKYAKGIKFALINYTYGVNVGIPSENSFCVNVTNKDAMLSDINNAKAQNADVIIACMHWGGLSSNKPNENQTTTADFLFKNGVDIILGSHPQVLQPMEKRKVTLEDGTIKDGLIIYSLGSLVPDQYKEDYRNSILLNISVTKHKETGGVTIDAVRYMPINFYDFNYESRKYRVIDINSALSAYDDGNRETIDSPELYDYLKAQAQNIKNSIKPQSWLI